MADAGLVIFYLAAAIVQWALGAFLLVARRRDDALFVMGVLFATNGSLSVMQLVMHIGGSTHVSDAALRTWWLFDQMTNLLIIYFALAYPTRVAWLQRYPGAFRGTFIAVAVFFIGASLVNPALNGGTLGARGGHFTGFVPHFQYFLFTVVNGSAFGVLLVRWAWLMGRMDDTALLRQFRLVFAAFALRAVHVQMRRSTPFTPYAERPPSPLVDWVFYAYQDMHSAFNLGAVAFAAGVLFWTLRRAEPQLRAACLLVLAFMAAGFLEGMLARDAYGLWAKTREASTLALVLGQADYMLVRPLMVWLAMASHQFAHVTMRSATRAQLVLFAFGATSLYGGFLALSWEFPAAWFVALLTAVSLAGLLAAALRQPITSMLRLTEEAEDEGQSSLYLAVLNDVKRQGTMRAQDRDELDRLANHLGLGADQQRALESSILGLARKSANVQQPAGQAN